MPKLEQPQVDAAYRMFHGENRDLGQIARELGCEADDLTPFLCRAPVTYRPARAGKPKTTLGHAIRLGRDAIARSRQLDRADLDSLAALA